MNILYLINFFVFIFFLFLIIYLLRLSFKHAEYKKQLKGYLDNSVLLTAPERQELVSGLTKDELDFKKSVNALLAYTLIAIVSLALLLLFAKSNTLFINIALAYLIIGAFLVFFYRSRRSFRNQQLVKQLPHAIDIIIHYTIANTSLKEILTLITNQVPKPLANFFRQASQKVNGGADVSAALHEAARPYRLFQLDYFVSILILQQEMGTDTIKLLRRLEEVLRREKILQQKIKAIKADLDAAQWGIIIILLVMLLVSFHLKPEYMQLFLSNNWGLELLIGGVIFFLLGMFLIRRVMRVL